MLWANKARGLIPSFSESCANIAIFSFAESKKTLLSLVIRAFTLDFLGQPFFLAGKTSISESGLRGWRRFVSDERLRDFLGQFLLLLDNYGLTSKNCSEDPWRFVSGG